MCSSLQSKNIGGTLEVAFVCNHWAIEGMKGGREESDCWLVKRCHITCIELNAR